MNPESSPTPESVADLGTCRYCRREFRFIRPPAGTLGASFTPTVCAACSDSPTGPGVTAAEDTATARLERWLAVCPPAYRLSGDPLPPGTPRDALAIMTVPDRLPPDLLAACLGWEYGVRGLGIVGSSGLGKTRAMMLLLRRLIMEDGRDCEYVSETELADSVISLALTDGAALSRRLARLCTVDVLFLDDLGQGRMSDRVEAAMWHIAETRTKHLRPVLFSTQADAGNGLHGATGNRRRADAIERRLIQFSRIAEF